MCQFLLASIVSDENGLLLFKLFFPYRYGFVSVPTPLRFFSLPLDLRSLTVISLSIDFFALIILFGGFRTLGNFISQRIVWPEI